MEACRCCKSPYLTKRIIDGKVLYLCLICSALNEENEKEQEYRMIMKIIADDLYALKIHAKDFGVDINNRNEIEKIFPEIKHCFAFAADLMIAQYEKEKLESHIKQKYFNIS